MYILFDAILLNLFDDMDNLQKLKNDNIEEDVDLQKEQMLIENNIL